jgi:hypothetical protein
MKSSIPIGLSLNGTLVASACLPYLPTYLTTYMTFFWTVEVAPVKRNTNLQLGQVGFISN